MSENEDNSAQEQLHFRLTKHEMDMLDKLCEVNARKRSNIILLLIAKAHRQLRQHPATRINP